MRDWVGLVELSEKRRKSASFMLILAVSAINLVFSDLSGSRLGS
jgi:hypothetical protein